MPPRTGRSAGPDPGSRRRGRLTRHRFLGRRRASRSPARRPRPPAAGAEQDRPRRLADRAVERRGPRTDPGAGGVDAADRARDPRSGRGRRTAGRARRAGHHGRRRCAGRNAGAERDRRRRRRNVAARTGAPAACVPRLRGRRDAPYTGRRVRRRRSRVRRPAAAAPARGAGLGGRCGGRSRRGRTALVAYRGRRRDLVAQQHGCGPRGRSRCRRAGFRSGPGHAVFPRRTADPQCQRSLPGRRRGRGVGGRLAHRCRVRAAGPDGRPPHPAAGRPRLAAAGAIAVRRGAGLGGLGRRGDRRAAGFGLACPGRDRCAGALAQGASPGSSPREP